MGCGTQVPWQTSPLEQQPTLPPHVWPDVAHVGAGGGGGGGGGPGGKQTLPLAVLVHISLVTQHLVDAQPPPFLGVQIGVGGGPAGGGGFGVGNGVGFGVGFGMGNGLGKGGKEEPPHWPVTRLHDPWQHFLW